MKFPKNRKNIYVVIRDIPGRRPAILGVFADLGQADDYKDACASVWTEASNDTAAVFDVVISTFYG